MRYAADNGLAEKVIVLGEADQQIGAVVDQHQFEANKSLMVCDIEGAEFDLLTENFLQQFNGTTMVVELHDRLKFNSTLPRQQLIDRLPEGYQYLVLTGQPARWQGIDDFEMLSDNDRGLAISEGRKARGEWLFAWPGT